MGFWGVAVVALVFAALAAVLLYAFAVWVSVSDESYLATVWGLVKQMLSGDFFK